MPAVDPYFGMGSLATLVVGVAAMVVITTLSSRSDMPTWLLLIVMILIGLVGKDEVAGAAAVGQFLIECVEFVLVATLAVLLVVPAVLLIGSIVVIPICWLMEEHRVAFAGVLMILAGSTIWNITAMVLAAEARKQQNIAAMVAAAEVRKQETKPAAAPRPWPDRDQPLFTNLPPVLKNSPLPMQETDALGGGGSPALADLASRADIGSSVHHPRMLVRVKGPRATFGASF